jgi:rhodanese-related sulfurtransferase
MALALGLALVSTLSFAQETERAPASKTHVLTRAELDALLAKPDRLLIIDVRRPDEIASIGGFAVYLNLQPGDVEKNLASIPRERTIVTVSNHAARGGRVADALAARGFKVAGTIGAQNYEADGGTLTKIVPPEPEAASTPR